MKKFTISCDFGGQMSPFTIFIGNPEKQHHPLHFQADWLSKNRGGMIPGEIMDAISQLQELANKNRVSLEGLCVYALGTDEEKEELEDKENAADADEENINDEQVDDERHDINDQHEHDTSESIEDMASEGGHVEDESP